MALQQPLEIGEVEDRRPYVELYVSAQAVPLVLLKLQFGTGCSKLAALLEKQHGDGNGEASLVVVVEAISVEEGLVRPALTHAGQFGLGEGQQPLRGEKALRLSLLDLGAHLEQIGVSLRGRLEQTVELRGVQAAATKAGEHGRRISG